MRKSILFLTDLTNGENEDLITIDFLKRDFNITVSYLTNLETIEDDFDLIVIRNTWPSDESKFHGYNKLSEEFFKRAKRKKLKIYNDMNANCDREGKDYLVELYKKSYPVIPSVDSLEDLHLLPQASEYLIKPKDGFSSKGIKTIQRKDLKKVELKNKVVQPKLDFKHELSFYFVDNELLYCLIFEPSKIPKWPKPKYYKPTDNDILFAKKFIEWNKMKFGICRIDTLRLHNGKLLLLEIEDASPYFSITETNKRLKELFLKKFSKSVKNCLSVDI